MNLDHHSRPRVLESILLGIQADAANTDAQRWLRQNAAAIRRGYDEMVAEKEEEARRG